MMADHSSPRRRRSPESSVGGIRKDRESRRAPSEIVYGEQPRTMRPGPSTDIPVDRGMNQAYGGNTTYLSSSSSSSSSYELIDISRSYPPNRSGIATFFTAPSEHRARKLRKRKSNRMFKLNNSSSSSVNSDLAYGTGYIRRPKLRRVRSRSGKDIDREGIRYSDRERERQRYGEGARHGGSERHGNASGAERRGYGSGSERRGNTNAEILAVGAGLAALAREQNKHDLKNRNGKSPQFGAGVASSRYDGPSGSRGLAPSKVSHESDTYDEDGWESASDAESENSVDSKLAFGAEASGWWGKELHRPLSRKNTVVDPRLFGPENSLHGFVDQPVGFGNVTWTSTEDFGQQYRTQSTSVVQNESFSGSQASLQQVFPVQNSRDPTRFDAARSSVASGSEPYMSSGRPGPAPLQHPQPYTPVSQSVYEPSYSAVSENSGILKKSHSSSGKGISVAQAALVGVAGAAVGAAIASARSYDRKDNDREDYSRVSSKHRDDERDDGSRISLRRRDEEPDDVSRISSKRREDDRDDSSRVSHKRRDSDKKGSKDERRKDKRDSPDRDDRREKRRDKDRKKDGSRYSDEDRREKKREKRRDDVRDDQRETRREKDDRRGERSEVAVRPEPRYEDRRSKGEAAISTVPTIDPFMFQVDDNAFPTPVNQYTEGHGLHDSGPRVVTIERVPDFSRERSSSIKDQQPASMIEHGGDYTQYNDRDRYREAVTDHGLHDAEVAYSEAYHSTAPIAAAAIGAAAAVVGTEIYRESRSEKRRNERRSGKVSDYDERDYRGREPSQVPIKERDPIQEEADRAYREIVMARKIASQVIRSRSNSPDGSVVSKYSHRDEPEEVQIVTPPEMDHPKIKGPYDAPNADFNPDYHFDDPRELRTFRPQTPVINQGYRDPDALEPRPLLNLVRPTPVPSPNPERQAPKEDSSRSEPTHAETSRSTPTTPTTPIRAEPRSESSRSSPAPSESARSEPPTRSSKSRGRGEKQRTAMSDVEKSNGMDSPTGSVVSKAVTWGENETKHFNAESPSDHRDEYVSSSDVLTYEKSPRPDPKPDAKPSKGWGAIAAGVLGAGAGVAVVQASDTASSKKSKGRENQSKENEKAKIPPNNYEYRETVTESETPKPKGRKRSPSPPSPGPKPTIQSGHIPGAFDDDLEFTANVAAGLKDAGFNSDIVINDPNFRRRTSPPGSNDRLYENVSDVSHMPAAASGWSGSGFVTGEEATTPLERQSISPEGDEYPVKLNKKEQRKRDKAKRQSAEFTTSPGEPASTPKEDDQDFYFSEPKLSKKEQKKRDKEAKRQSTLAEEVAPIFKPVVNREVADDPESYFVETPKKKKKSKRDSAVFGDEPEAASPNVSSASRKVSVPVDAFDDLQNDDEWSESKKSKSKSQRDSEPYGSPSRSSGVSEPSYPAAISLPQSEASGRSSSSRKKDKSRSYDDYEPDSAEVSLPRSEVSERSSSKRGEKSKSYDHYEHDPATVSLPPSTPSETSQDRDYDESRKSRKSSLRDSGIFDARDRSVASEAASRQDDELKQKKKPHRSSTRDRDDFDDARSVVSVASTPGGDEDGRKSKKKEKEKKSGGFFGLFGSKSEVSAREETPKSSKDEFEDAKSKKKKRYSMPDSSSLNGALGSQSVGDLSRSASNGHDSNRYDDDDGARSDGERKKSRSRGSSTPSKKESFLDNPGTLGARVGIVGAAAALAAHQRSQSNADDAYKEALHRGHSDGTEKRLERHIEFDPEITRREIRPSIDPQYGDLLPLPPSEPATPRSEEFEELPGLPESRPDTPEDERLAREKMKSLARKHLYETPLKSPSQSAVPINFRIGRGKNSAPPSPSLPRNTPLQSPQTPSTETFGFSRSSRNRPTSWESAKEYRPLYLPESVRRGSTTKVAEEEEPLPELPDSMATSRSSSQLDFEDAREDFSPSDSLSRQGLSIDTLSHEQSGLFDSQQSTPKAKVVFYDDEKTVPFSKDHTRYLAADAIVGAALAGTVAYLASSHDDVETPISSRQPSSIDPKSQDRNSHLPQSSLMSRNADIPIDESANSPSYSKSQSLDGIQGGGRERDLETLVSGAPVGGAEPRESSFGNSKKDKKDKKKEKLSRFSIQEDPLLTEPAFEAAPVEPVQVVAEPEDMFWMAKSKKEKKKGKLSQSVTQDELSLAESIVEAASEVPLKAFAEPEDEVSIPKSSKDKKKDRKKGRSIASWDIEGAASPSKPVTEEPVTETSKDESEPPLDTSVSLVPVDDFFTPSKKNKKYKKEFIAPAFEPEPESETDIFELAPEAPEDLSGEGIADTSSSFAEPHSFQEFSTPFSKKGKKNKKGNSDLTWDESSGQKFEESVQESPHDQTRDIAEDLEARTVITTDEAEAEFSKTKSKKDKKKDKKGKYKSSWDEPEENYSSISNEVPAESTQELAADAPASLEFETADDFSPFKSKKDKKKDKKKGKSVDAYSEPIPEVISEHISESPHLASTPALEESDNVFALKSKKGETKDKRKGKSAVFWDTEPEIATTETLGKENPPNFDLELKKDSFHDFPEEATTDPTAISNSQNIATSKDLKEAPLDTAPEAITTPDKFSMDPKKGKRKKGKSAAELEDFEEPASTPLSQVAENFTTSMPESKKGKKKGKKIQSWDVEPDITEVSPNDERSIEPKRETLEGSTEDAFEDFATLTSQKGKETKVQSWDVEPETPQDGPEAVKLTEAEELEAAPPQDTFDEFSTPTSKRGKKNKKGKSQKWDLEEVPATPQNFATPEVPSVKATPMVGPGGWIETPATPFATSGHGPTDVSSKDIQGNDYFSSTMLPGAAAIAGAALLASNESAEKTSLDEGPNRPTPDGFAAGYKEDQLSLAKQMQEEFAKKSSKKNNKKNRESLPGTPEAESSRSRAVDDAEDVQPRARSLSIGAPADTERPMLYSKEQLELARQMKEDFAKGGSKKSKKGKKTRQDTWDDTIPDHPSEDFVASGPGVVEDAPRPEITGEAPDGLVPGYTENPLEKGVSKKSKKDKKKNQQDTWADAIREAIPVEKQTFPTEVATVQDSADGTYKRDGFEAGYQEDQLSLARQLQAEFGKKASKKDKKKRSASQTPREEEARDDDFGQSKPFWADSPADAVSPLESVPLEKNTTRDGLAAGYREDQLELARQLKEEFGSGSSKKGKKDKKGKKSKGADDDWDTPQTLIEKPTPISDEPVPDEDEFAVTSGNKPKKDKKNKIHQSITQGASDDALSMDSQERNNNEVLQTKLDEPTNPPIAGDLEEEFASTTKSSKKDKKGKKRQVLLRSIADDNLKSRDLDAPAVFGDFLTDEPANLDLEPTGTPEIAAEDAVAEILEPKDDYREASSKKSKKDKKGKKRDSSVPTMPIEKFSASIEPEHADLPSSADLAEPDSVTISTDPVDAAGEDDFAFIPAKNSKKDKKSKKRDSSIATAPTGETFTSGDLPKSIDLTEAEPVTTPTEPVDAAPDKEFAVTTSKKSKKDKNGKKRDSSVPSTPVEELSASQDFRGDLSMATDLVEEESTTTSPGLADATGPDESSFTTPQKSKKSNKKNNQSVAAQDIISGLVAGPQTRSAPIDEPSSSFVTAESSTPETTVDPQDYFGLFSKKSKKDKKKRGSLLRNSSTYDDLIDESTETSNVQSETPSETEQLDAAEDDDAFGFSSKKSKKDKKKIRQSMQEFFTPEETFTGEPTPMNSVQPEIVDATAIEERRFLDTTARDLDLDETTNKPTETAEDERDSFNTKKSKKDKKKTRKDSFKPEPTEPSSSLTGLYPPTESSNTAVEAPLFTEPPGMPSPEESRAPATVLAADGTGVLDSFSAKKSKDKKKNKNKELPIDSGEASGTSTPLDDTQEAKLDVLGHNGNRLPPFEIAHDPFIPATVSAFVDDTLREVGEVNVDDGPAMSSEKAELPVVKEESEQDEWTSFSTRPSKKDKKKDKKEKSKSGLSTPIESVPEDVAPIEEARDVSESIHVTKPAVEELAQDERTSISAKPSKRDKKRNSGMSTPVDAVPDSGKASDELVTNEPFTTLPEEPTTDEFDSYSTTVSKKDKKTRKSPLLTPLEGMPEPSGSAKKCYDESAAVIAKQELEKSETPQLAVTEEPAGDDWGVNPSKKSKKDKKKGKSKTSFDEIAEPSLKKTASLAIEEPVKIEGSQPSVLEEPVPASVHDRWTTPGKESEMDKKNHKSVADTTFDASAQHSGSAQEYSEEAPLLEPSKHVVQEPQLSVTEEPTLASADDEWPPKSSKKSKKDKNRISKTPTTFDEILEPSATPEDVPASSPDTNVEEPANLAEEPVNPSAGAVGDEWSSFSTSNKSKKNKNKSRFSIPKDETTVPLPRVDLAEQDIPVPSEEKALDTSSAFAQPLIGDKWASPGKNLQGDLSESKDEFPESMSARSEANVSPATIEDITAEQSLGIVEPKADENWATPGKKSKDKKKNKSGNSSPKDDISEPALASFEQEPKEPPVEECDSFTTSKKSKNDKKRKSGAATLAEEPILEITTSFDDPSKQDIVEGPSKLEENGSREVVQEAVDEWLAPSKKSKKEKKGTSETSIPTGEPSFCASPEVAKVTTATEIIKEPAESELPSTKLGHLSEKSHLGEALAAGVSHHELTLASSNSPEKAEEPADEWDSFPTKKSNKGKKKKKSGRSTPVEQVLRPSPIVEEQVKTAIVDERMPIKNVSDSREIVVPIITEDAPAEPEEEWDSSSIKKSKDKKCKGKNNTFIEAPESIQDPIPSLPDIEPSISKEAAESAVVADASQGPVDGFEPLSTKKSKKNKKGRGKQNSVAEEPQSFYETIPTPAEEKITPPSTDLLDVALAADTPQEAVDDLKSISTRNLEKDEKSKSKAKDVLEEPEHPYGAPPAQEIVEPIKVDELIAEEPSQELGDEWGAVSVRKSKKDKKKRKSGISTSADEATPIAVPASQQSYFEDVKQPVSRQVHEEPTEIEPFAPVEEATQEPVDEFSFSTKKSKKDNKDERGSRVGSITDVSPGATTLAGFELSNAIYQDEQTPVKKERTMETTPPIEASHSGKLKEDDPFNSLTRKSSKKDKRKRQATVDPAITDDSSATTAPITSWAEEVEEAEVIRTLPVIEDIAKDESLSHIAKTTESSPVDDFVRPNKKGKKGKKTKSVDNSRMPVTFDTSKKESVKDESSSSGACVAALVTGAAVVAASVKAKESEREPEKPLEPVRKLSKKEKRKQSIDKRTPTSDIFDDDALWEGKDSKEFEEKETMERDVDDVNDDGFWSPPQQQDSFMTAGTSFQEPHLSGDSVMDRGGPWTMPMDRPVSPPGDMDFAQTLSQETSNTSRDVLAEQHQPSIFSPASTDKDLSAESPQVDRNPYRNSGKFARSGFSDLPVLEEESPSYPDYNPKPRSNEEHANRDSAFVGASPIPPQAAFADNSDHVRDSGVHLREFSPARTPISTSDAAIARLSWPVVDEESETVDLDKSMKYRMEKTPDKKDQRKSHRSEEFYKPKEEANRSFEVYKTKDRKNRGDEMYVPEADPVTDLLRNHRAETPTRKTQLQYEPASRELLPSQRANEEKHPDPHRISTIHSHEDKSHEYHENKRSIIGQPAAQRMKDNKPVDLHESQTVHPSGDRSGSFHDDKITSRDLTPSKEKSTILTPSESSRRPTDESIVKKRLQKFQTPEAHQSPSSKSETRSVKDRVQSLQSPDLHTPTKSKEKSYSELAHLRRPKAEQSQGISDNTIAAGAAIVGAAGLGFAAARQFSQENRSASAASSRSISNINRLRTPNRPDSANSNRTSTPPLRRSSGRKVSGDLRSLSQRSQVDLAKEAELAAITKTASAAVNNNNSTPTPANPTANEGRVRAKDMADVYDGYGEGRMGSPRSPTRPHSMRRRQSMQVLDLESKVEQLTAENRLLADAKAQAERSLHSSTNVSSALVEKDAEIDSLKRTLEWLQTEVSRLTEVNDGLNSANVTLGNQSNQRYSQLESQHAQTQRELQEARDAHTHVTSGMEGIVLAQVQAATQKKDEEIAQLRAELETTKQRIRQMQAQILLSKTSDIDFLTIRDEDYFDNACQQLCQHVQQWVLRFSKFSDMRACRLTSEINNDKTMDRLDNAILDGSDVDSYLTDRVKRRDVFMSMTMTMIWEFIFTRYLFGMDREQRQKLKSLEKLLSEVGPAAAVHQWRATTLTLLSKRDAFLRQCEQDTQAVVHAILETLSEILPPPSQLEDQIESQLKRVIKAAIDLSIEMRTQRAEYMMLPPLQPEYDANGDLASKVSFNAALMNERSGVTLSNEELENQKAVVRIVLFPLVVKKGDDRGEGDEEIVVCPAQVLVAKSKKSVRMLSPGRNLSKASMQSSMPADNNESMADV